MLDICLLGTGGMMPLPDRWLSSALFRYNGRLLLIDCGEGTQIPLKMSGFGFKAIDTILITHYHADHIAGLPGLLLSIGNSGRTEPLTLVGPSGLESVIKGLCIICPALPFELQLIEVNENHIFELKLGEFYINYLPVEHGMPCLAYGIEIKRQGIFLADKAKSADIPVKYWKQLQKGNDIILNGEIVEAGFYMGKPRKGLKVSYSTDTRPTEGLEKFIIESDLFICEGMFGTDDKQMKAIEKKHMLFSEAARLALNGNVKELLLTHFSPSLVNPEEYISEAGNIFSNSFTGKDLMVKTLKFHD